MYDYLYSVSQSGLYALINDSDKKVMVVQSSNILSSIGRLIQALRENRHPNKELTQDQNKLRFEILETKLDKPTRLVRHTYYSKQYIKSGYNLYNKKLLLDYKPEIRISLDVAYPVLVVLRNQRNDINVVGVFHKMTEARHFLNQYYSHDILQVVYANNPLTQQYLKENR